MNAKRVLPFFLVACVMLSSLAVLPLALADAPWLSGWNSRLSFYLEGGSPLNASEAVQVQLTVLNQTGTNTVNSTTFYLPNLTQGDFEDLRVTASDGLTLYPVWNQTTVSGVNCTFWVKVPAVNATYYLYCSNPSAVNVWDKAAVFVDVVSGVVGAWTMEEALATDPVTDYSGNGNNGTPVNVTPTNGKFTGKNGKAYAGANSYVSINKVEPSQITIYVWIKNDNPTTVGGLYSTSRTGATGKGYNLWWGTPANSQVIFDCSNKRLSSTTTILANDTNWHNIIAKLDNTTLRLKIDNTAQNTTTGVVFAASTNAKAFFGAVNSNASPDNPQANEYYKGAECSLIIFNAATTDIQDTNMYANYPDVGLSPGEALVRNFVYSVPVVSAFGVLEYYVEPTPSPSPVPDVTTEDAVGLAAVAVVFAVALPCAFLMMRRKKEDD